MRYADLAHSRRSPLRGPVASPGRLSLPNGLSAPALHLSLPNAQRPEVVGSSFPNPPPTTRWPFPGHHPIFPSCPALASAVPSATPPPRAPTQSSAPPRPHSDRHPLHPGTDSSGPDFGTMVMAEGTAVLRRNRPGTKAQVPTLHLFCGAEHSVLSRTAPGSWPPLKGGWAGAAGRQAGALVPGLLFGASAPQYGCGGDGGPLRLRSPDLRVGVKGGWGPLRTGIWGLSAETACSRLSLEIP